MTDDDRHTVLVVEDDPATRTFLADNLSADGYEPLLADCTRVALKLMETHAPDIAIVDVGLPDASGLELIERVRGADGLGTRLDRSIPLVVVSGRGTEVDRLRGFDRGCDDYVVKPFSYPELLSRLRAVLARCGPRVRTGRIKAGELEIDPRTQIVTLRGRRVDLPTKEFALLRTLASDPTRVWTKEELLRGVWGFRSMGQTRTLDSHACRLRRKLGTEGDKFVVNVWGVGYRLVDPVIPA